MMCRAGHDTTASGISWTLYSLAANPEHQKLCQQEIDEVLAGRDNQNIEWWVLGIVIANTLTYTNPTIPNPNHPNGSPLVNILCSPRPLFSLLEHADLHIVRSTLVYTARRLQLIPDKTEFILKVDYTCTASTSSHNYRQHYYQRWRCRHQACRLCPWSWSALGQPTRNAFSH